MAPNATALEQKFTAAVDALIDRVKDDRATLAAILCGSLSHDTVWTKSDVDLVFVTIDDRKVDAGLIALDADGVNVHAMLVPRAEFRRMVDGAVHHSFVHSFLAKGRLLYTHDPSIAQLCERLQARGSRDAAIQVLRAATHALAAIDKAHKWFVTRHDLDYTALWILYAATPLAFIEVISAGRLADREVLPQALGLNPAFFKMIYVDLINHRKTEKAVKAALDSVDAYVASRADTIFAPIIEHLREAGDVRSARDIDDHFRKTCNIEGVTTACEYLADRGTIVKASTSVQLTRKSTAMVQELAFFLPGAEREGF